MRSEYRLSDIIEIIGGGTPKTSKREYWNGSIPWLSVKDFNNNSRYVYNTEKKITEQGLSNSTTTLLSKDDIIISARGTVGALAMIPYPMAFNQSCYGIRAKKDKIISTYLYYLLKNNVQLLKQRTHGSVFDTITRKSFDDVIVQLPDMEEQKKVAFILSILDDKIELNQRINDNLQQQISEIYKAWYQDFSCVADIPFIESEYGMIPQGWHYSTLGNLCKSISVTHKFDKDKLIFLNTGDIEDGRFLHANYIAVSDMPGQAKKTIVQGDILYSEIRPINRHFAFVNFPSADYVVSTKLMVIRASSFDSHRLYHFLTSPDILSGLQMQAESRSGTFPQIRFDNVSRLPILIADDMTETAFITLLHAVYEQTYHNNCEIEKLSALRDSLLPRLMRGEIDVSGIKL